MNDHKRAQMQTEAMIIESLLNAAEAIFSSDTIEDALPLIEQARSRAAALNVALDSVNAVGDMA
jgi:hypothetical protein